MYGMVTVPLEKIRNTPKKIRSLEIFVYICTMRQKLTAKEEQLMSLFWEHGDLFIRDLVALLPEPRPHYNTVATLVKFLEEKGFLEREPMAVPRGDRGRDGGPVL